MDCKHCEHCDLTTNTCYITGEMCYRNYVCLHDNCPNFVLGTYTTNTEGEFTDDTYND